MASYKAGDTCIEFFATNDPGTGASADAASTPTGGLYHNGTLDGSVTVTVTHVSTGQYKATATIPIGYASGDKVHLIVAATTENSLTSTNVAASEVIGSYVLDGARNSDLLAEMQSFGQYLLVNDSSATANSFVVAGLPSNATLNSYVGKLIVVFSGSGDAVGQSALITASTAGPNVRFTLGSGLTAPPSNNAFLLMIDPPS